MSEPSPTSAQRLEAVRAEIKALAPAHRRDAGALAFGIEAIDARLASLFLPSLATDRLRRLAATAGRPPDRAGIRASPCG